MVRLFRLILSPVFHSIEKTIGEEPTAVKVHFAKQGGVLSIMLEIINGSAIELGQNHEIGRHPFELSRHMAVGTSAGTLHLYQDGEVGFELSYAPPLPEFFTSAQIILPLEKNTGQPPVSGDKEEAEDYPFISKRHNCIRVKIVDESIPLIYYINGERKEGHAGENVIDMDFGDRFEMRATDYPGISLGENRSDGYQLFEGRDISLGYNGEMLNKLIELYNII